MKHRKFSLRLLAAALILTLGASAFTTPAMAVEESFEEAVKTEWTAEELTETEEEFAETEVEVSEEETREISEEETTEEASEALTEEETTEEPQTAEEEVLPAEEETAEILPETQEETEEETLSEETEDAVAPVKDSVDAVKAASLTAPTDMNAIANNQYSIDVSWGAVDGATGYIVYKHNGTKWVQKASVTTTTWTDDEEDMEIGTSCRYTVAATGTVDGKAVQSSYNSTGVTAIVSPPQPKAETPVCMGKNKLLLTWDPAENANYYFVYRKEEGGSWKKCSSTLKETVTSYLDETCEYGKTYIYAVVSGTKVDGTTYWSFRGANGKVQLGAPGMQTVQGKTVAAKYVKVPQVELSGAVCTAYKTITVTWKPVTGADGYIIYRKVKGGKYKKKGTVTGSSTVTFTDKKAKFGTKYWYTVRAYVKYDSTTKKSAAWNEKGVAAKSTLPAPAKLTAQGAGLKAVTISWDKIKGAQGYYIYRKAKSSTKKWTKIGETGRKTFTFTDKSIESGSSYLYTVRGWRKNGKKVVKGKYDTDGVKGAPSITKKIKNGLQLYYNEKGNLITDTEDIIGSRGSYVIEVDWNDNIVTIYAKGDKGTYNLPVKAFRCSTGEATPIGTFYTPAKYRWHMLNGGVYGQWCTRIYAGFLFHSVMYNSQNANTLRTGAYNKLGTKASHGCVRLPCVAAKWIYDHCSLGTKVIIKKDCKNPFGKPAAIKVGSSHTWDPTDPNMAYKCKANGCH